GAGTQTPRKFIVQSCAWSGVMERMTALLSNTTTESSAATTSTGGCSTPLRNASGGAQGLGGRAGTSMPSSVPCRCTMRSPRRVSKGMAGPVWPRGSKRPCAVATGAWRTGPPRCSACISTHATLTCPAPWHVPCAPMRALDFLLWTRGRRADEHPDGTDVLINVWPVDALPRPDNLEVLPLRGGGIGQTPRPHEWDTD